MSPYEALRGELIAQVDDHLGDSISVELDDGGLVTLQGFVKRSDPDFSGEGFKSGPSRWHVKLNKSADNVALLPRGPASIRRLTAPILDSVYKPAAGAMSDDGTAWSFDLQKAPA